LRNNKNLERGELFGKLDFFTAEAGVDHNIETDEICVSIGIIDKFLKINFKLLRYQ